jgi:hypothetical protein
MRFADRPWRYNPNMSARPLARQIALVAFVEAALLGPASADVSGHLFVITQESGKTRVLDVLPNGKQRAVLYELPGDEIEGITIDREGRRIALRRKSEAQIILYDTVTKQSTKLLGSGGAQPGRFFKKRKALLIVRRVDPDTPGKFGIYDLDQQRIVREFEGSTADISVLDDSVFVARRPSASQLDVYRYLPEADELRKVKGLALDDFEQGDVNEVIGLSRDTFVFRASGEHEHRYYADDGEPFFKGQGPRAGCCYQEQYSLTFSDDGRFAAYAERDWGELTYFVFINMHTNQRKAVPAYGAFPRILDGKLYFMSDPSFVRTQKPDFRQIEKYTLYVFDPKSGSISALRHFGGHAEFLHAQ